MEPHYHLLFEKQGIWFRHPRTEKISGRSHSFGQSLRHREKLRAHGRCVLPAAHVPACPPTIQTGCGLLHTDRQWKRELLFVSLHKLMLYKSAAIRRSRRICPKMFRCFRHPICIDTIQTTLVSSDMQQNGFKKSRRTSKRISAVQSSGSDERGHPWKLFHSERLLLCSIGKPWQSPCIQWFHQWQRIESCGQIQSIWNGRGFLFRLCRTIQKIPPARLYQPSKQCGSNGGIQRPFQ